MCVCANQTICNNLTIGCLVGVFFLHFVYLCAFHVNVFDHCGYRNRELSAFSTRKEETNQNHRNSNEKKKNRTQNFGACIIHLYNLIVLCVLYTQTAHGERIEIIFS